MQHKRGLLFIAGLEYQQFNERFAQNTTTVREETVIGVIAVVENADGEVIETIMGPKVITTTVETEFKIHNNYRFWNIPIGVGMAWHNRGVTYKSMGGLQYNLGFRFSGTLLDNDLALVAIKKSDDRYATFFQKRMGMGLWLAAEYNRPLSKRMFLSIGPKVQIPLSTLTVDDYVLSQRYVPISLNLGINYLLNPKKPKRRKRRGEVE